MRKKKNRLKVLIFLVFSIHFPPLLGDTIDDYLKEEEKLTKEALLTDAVLVRKPRNSKLEEQNLAAEFEKPSATLPISVKKMLKKFGYPYRTFFPLGSTGEPRPYLIWEYRVFGSSGGLLRFKLAFGENSSVVAKEIFRIPHNKSNTQPKPR